MPSFVLLQGDACRLPLADRSVHCVVTSPPYWALRDYGVPGQIGLEPTPSAYVETMVTVFRELHRILRDDGTVWLNLGDSYANDTKWGGYSSTKNRSSFEGGYVGQRASRDTGIRPKNLMGIPWRVALALQADGWILRSDVIWSKPNVMPESVVDRPTRSHEYLFLLAKQEKYYYDPDAIREPMKAPEASTAEDVDRAFSRRRKTAVEKRQDEIRRHVPGSEQDALGVGFQMPEKWNNPLGRNKRTVWEIPSTPFGGAHFATFPPALVEPCIRAGTSERGCCPICGRGWVRIIEKQRHATRPGLSTKTTKAELVDGQIIAGRLDANVIGNRDPQRHVTEVFAVGWRPACEHNVGEPIASMVLDPFNGSGTTGVVALALGRSYVGLDLNPDYLRLARQRIERPHARLPRPARPESHPLFKD